MGGVCDEGRKFPSLAEESGRAMKGELPPSLYNLKMQRRENFPHPCRSVGTTYNERTGSWVLNQRSRRKMEPGWFPLFSSALGDGKHMRDEGRCSPNLTGSSKDDQRCVDEERDFPDLVV
ncbi:hypothetical protein PHLCEN_2v2566 [Hermanssonia centrifuga]|uniref:Uncharacterized protein n=1 Tax=Hermanssonia centrifuga TaxID=98765 RepID=A0A2R6RLJ6_9APHY|nr:hypothetical protein PHLCEN_2v2566 [Hermanssonia centrifuga]